MKKLVGLLIVSCTFQLSGCLKSNNAPAVSVGSEATPTPTATPTAAPTATVTVTTPASNGTYVVASNVAAFTIAGACSPDGAPLTISGSGTGSGSGVCSGSAYSINMSLDEYPETTSNGISLTVSYAGASAVRTLNKDTEAPTANSISINGGDANSYLMDVTLTLASTGVASMYITNTSGCGSDGSWETYATTSESWTLQSSSAPNTVYVKFKDTAGNETSCVSDSITHTPGSVSVTTPASDGAYVLASNASAYSIAGACNYNGVPVTISGSGTGSGTCSSSAYSINLNLSALVDTTSNGISLTVSHAGASAARTLNKDTEAPTANSISINSGDATTTTLDATLTLSSTGANEMYITNTADCGSGSGWEAYATSRPWTLPNSNASNTVYAKFKDNVGNETSCSSDSISHQTPLTVVAAYPTNGAKWNDYVKNDGTNWFDATDTACAATEVGFWTTACLHGGERKKVSVSGESSCSGLSATDYLGAFNWVCDDSSETAIFYSTGLASGKGLSDLIDFTDGTWKTNYVTVVTGSGNRSSSAATWWSNTITALPDNSTGAVTSLSTVSTIYYLSASRQTAGYNIDGDKIALVLDPSATLSWKTAGAANCNESTGEVSTSSKCLLASGSQSFIWIEGTFDGVSTGNSVYGLDTYNLKNFRIHKTTMLNTYAIDRGGMNILTSARGYFTSVYMKSGGGIRIWNSSSSNYSESYHYFDDLQIGKLSSKGLYLMRAKYNRFHNIRAGVTANETIYLFSDTNNYGEVNAFNHFSEIYTAGSVSASSGTIYDGYGGYNVFNRVVVANGRQSGFIHESGWNLAGYSYAGYDKLTAFTAANNYNYGIGFLQYDWNNRNRKGVVHNVFSTNNAYGVGGGNYLDNMTFSQIASVENTNELYLNSTYDVKFTGNLLVGNVATCQIGTVNSSTPGLVNGTCANNGLSDATLGTGRSTSTSYVGRISSDDASNTQDSNGTGSYSSLTDWTTFISSFRLWGRNASDYTYRLPCGWNGNETCRIYDWRLFSSDTVLRNRTGNGGTANGTFTAGEACPVEVRGSESLTSVTGEVSGDSIGDDDGHCEGTEICTGETYLKNAIEIMFDDTDSLGADNPYKGDDDGLCETDEACLYTPNFGAYQGEGTLAECTFTGNGGPVTGVRMYGYLTNGY